MNAVQQQRLLQAALKLEERLAAPPAIDELADDAGLSPFHFQRLFQRFTGEPPAGYLRRLRLERAAAWLTFTERPAIDIAICVGYESREGFVRAFGKQFGTSPEEFRARSQMRLRRTAQRMRRRPPLDVRLIELPARRYAVLRSYGGIFAIARAWWRMLKALRKWNGFPRGGYVGINHDDTLLTAASRQRYDVGIEIPADCNPPAPLSVVDIAAGTYAAADYCGSVGGLFQAWDRLAYVWLPESPWHLRDVRCFDRYDAAQRPDRWIDLLRLVGSTSFRSTLHVPVQRTASAGLPEIG